MNSFRTMPETTLCNAAPAMLHALLRLKYAGKLHCSYDVLNPCWNHRADDVPGLHWASTPGYLISACPECRAMAAIAAAEVAKCSSWSREKGGTK